MTMLIIVLVIFFALVVLMNRSTCAFRRLIIRLPPRRWSVQQRLITLYTLLGLTIVLVTLLWLTTVLAAPPTVDTSPAPVITQADSLRVISQDAEPVTYTDTDPATLPLTLRSPVEERVSALWTNPEQTATFNALSLDVRFTAVSKRESDVITGSIFLDTDSDGLRKLDEMGLTGVEVIGPGVHQYFIPFRDGNLIQLFRKSNECQQSNGTVSNTLASHVSLTASSDDTIYFYDHYEDGYDTDPLTPGPTSETGVLNAGETRIFADNIDTTDLDNPDSLYYGGRDRITIVGEEAAVMRAAFPSPIDSTVGSNLAGAWEIEEVAEWGTTYIIPVGEDWRDRGGPLGHDFEFTGASFMALQDGTEIFYSGASICTDPFSAGETCFVPGAGDGAGRPGLNSDDEIIANGPVQAHLYSSICNLDFAGGPWSGNGFTLEPRNQWSSHYWSPVPDRTSCHNAKVDIFLYNPSPIKAIDITIDDGTTYSSIPLPPGPSSVRALIGGSLSESRGVEIYSQGEPFWGIVNMDTLNTNYEWGFSLIPEEELSSQVVIGWAPGNSNQPPLGVYPPNGNLAWVTAITDSVIYADFDQDGETDEIDCNGDGDAADSGECNGCNETDSHNGVPLSRGQTLRVADPHDTDMTSALIYADDLSKKIAVAWGEDPCVAGYGQPYLDLGYTALPMAIPSISKFDNLAYDVDGSGEITLGDLLAYTVVIFNNGYGPMNNVFMTDTLPYTFTDFIVDSIVAVPPSTVTCEYDDGDGSFSYTPVPTGTRNVDPVVQRLRCTWPRVDKQQAVTVTFQVEIEPDIPSNILEISNQAIISSDETEPKESRDPDNPQDPGTVTRIHHPILKIAKLANTDIISPGDLLTYTIVVSNVGTATAVDSLLVDIPPHWLTYEPDTLDVTSPVTQVITSTIPISQAQPDFNETYGDNFDSDDHNVMTEWNGNDGTLPWTAPWAEFGDDGTVTGGDVRILASSYANSPPAYLWIDEDNGTDKGLERCADLTNFVAPHLSYNLQGSGSNTSPDDTYRIDVNSTPLFTEVYDGSAGCDPRDRDLSAYAGNPNVCIAFVGEAGMDSNDFYRFDDIFIYEASRARIETVHLISTTTIISYITHPTEPTFISHTMQITKSLRFPPGSRFTATFQMRAGTPLADGLRMTNTVYITATNIHTTPYPLEANESTVVQSSDALKIYLPLVLRYWPPIPPRPEIDPIYNPDDDGNYIVKWSACTNTQSSTVTYFLHEDQRCDCDLIDPTEIYPGTSTSYTVNDQRMGYYCYSVKACNSWGCSGWSNEECVDVLWEHQWEHLGGNDNGSSRRPDGPLCSGKSYHGYPYGHNQGDEWDWFKICLDTGGSIEIDLTNFSKDIHDVQFSLLDQDQTTRRDYKHVWDPHPNDHYYLRYTGFAGEYFIGISPEKGTDIPYTLMATFPQTQYQRRQRRTDQTNAATGRR
jgi:uncharacterized repeat protein (TIGR01451 family)